MTKVKGDLSRLATDWMSDSENLSHLHTMWAPYADLACIALKKPAPPALQEARRDTVFKQVRYTDILDLLGDATNDPAHILGYLGLWQPAIGGWIQETVNQTHSMRGALEVLSFLSPLLDSQCVIQCFNRPDRYDVRLTHLLLPDPDNAMSCAIQVFTVLAAVNSRYWSGDMPDDVEIRIPTGDAHSLVRKAIEFHLPKTRWPAYVSRHDYRYYEVRVPKLNVAGNRITEVAPFRADTFKNIEDTLARDGIFKNRLYLDLVCQRWLLCNLKRQELDRFCTWMGMTRATMNRRFKENGMSWQELKIETRYRWTLGMKAAGHSDADVAEELGVTVKENNRWMRENYETIIHLREKRITLSKAE